MSAELIAQKAVEVRVPGDLPLHSVTWRLRDLLQQSLDVLQVWDSSDAEDDESIPLSFVTVPQVTPYSTPEILCEAHVIKPLTLLKRVHARVATHELLETLLKKGGSRKDRLGGDGTCH